MGPGTGLVLCMTLAVLTGWSMSELIDPLCMRARRYLLEYVEVAEVAAEVSTEVATEVAAV
eukprot:2727316-Rhodomonas_salina.1